MTKILIVEDEAIQRLALQDFLTKKGFTVLEAADGLVGLDVALKEHPDVTLLDVRMPKMGGMTMMHKLREDEWGKNASIIILTNYDANDELLLQMTKDLPSYYLVKALSSLESILEKINEVLETKAKSTK